MATVWRAAAGKMAGCVPRGPWGRMACAPLFTRQRQEQPEPKELKDDHVHELRYLQIKPESIQEYVKLTEGAIQHKFAAGAKLIGFWTTDIGEPRNLIVQIWEWANYKQRDEVTSTLSQHKQWKEYTAKAGPLIQTQNSTVIRKFDFWPLHYPKDKGIYELRTYDLNAGTVFVWQSYWQQGLKYRSKYVQPVGAWYSEIGHLHRVFHLWQYPDLDERRKLRELAWNEPGWAEVVELTLPLIQKMDCKILKPTSFSPLT